MFLSVCSNQSDLIFSANKPWKFTVQLPDTLPLGDYECALTELTVRRESSLDGLFLISSDLVAPSIWFNALRPGLRTFQLRSPKKKQNNYVDTVEFRNPYYLPVGKAQAREISFEIDTVPCQDKRYLHSQIRCVWLTLHLRCSD